MGEFVADRRIQLLRCRRAGAKQPAAAKRTVEDWRRDLQGKPPEAAYEMIVADGTLEAYEAFVALYTQPPFVRARVRLDGSPDGGLE